MCSCTTVCVDVQFIMCFICEHAITILSGKPKALHTFKFSNIMNKCSHKTLYNASIGRQCSVFIRQWGSKNDEQALGCSLHSVMDFRALDCSEGFLQVVKIPFLFPKWPPFPEGPELQLYSFIAPTPIIRRFTTPLSMDLLGCQLLAFAVTYKLEV